MYCGVSVSHKAWRFGSDRLIDGFELGVCSVTRTFHYLGHYIKEKSRVNKTVRERAEKML